MRRKRRKKNQAKAAQNPSDLGKQEQLAMEALRDGKFRKARDAFKILCKSDRAKFLPRLIEANLGLATEMLDKGQVREADQVLAYLKTIAPKEALAELEGKAARVAGDWEAIGADAAARLEEAVEKGMHRQAESLVDQAVVSFKPSESSSGVAKELNAVQEALKAICDERWREAAELMRPLAFQSPFRHWKMFVKGLAAFHQGEHERALSCFQRLPQGSVPVRAAKAYRWFLGEEIPLDKDISAFVCRLLGLPFGLELPLLEAEKAWRRGRHYEAYSGLRKAWKEFPSLQFGLPGELAEFFFKAPFAMSAEEYDAYYDSFGLLLDRRRCKNKFEKMSIQGMLCRRGKESMQPSFLAREWKEHVSLQSALYGPNPTRDSLAYAWLGDHLSQMAAVAPSPFFFMPVSKPRMRDERGAVAALEKSISLDPSHLDAYLKLCDVHEKRKDKSARNRLLDKMTNLFPDEKEVLFKAGRLCLDRKAIKKGLDYIERAFEHDRLDPGIVRELVRGHLLQVERDYRKGRLEAAREYWNRIEAHANDLPNDLHRSRWRLTAHRAVLEMECGDRETGEALRAKAQAEGPSLPAFLFCAHFIFRSCFPQGESPWLREFQQIPGAEARADEAVQLIRVFKHWAGQDILSGKFWLEYNALKIFLEYANRRPFTREDVVRLDAELKEVHLNGDLIVDFIRKILKTDPRDPLMRVLLLIAEQDHLYEEPQFLRRDLDKILKEARKRGDVEAIRQASELMEKLEHRPSAPPSPFEAFDAIAPPVDGFDEDDDDFEDEDYDEAFGRGDIVDDDEAAAMEPEFEEGFKAIIDELKNMPEKQIRKMRKERPDDMPGEIFDMLIDIAKGRAPQELLDQLERRFHLNQKNQPTSSEPDQSQLNLF